MQFLKTRACGTIGINCTAMIRDTSAVQDADPGGLDEVRLVSCRWSL
jgi:hypothetical protein